MIRVTAVTILSCFHSALKLVFDLMLISTDGYRARFYGRRPNTKVG